MPESKHLDTLLEIKENPSTSQRSLARKLNISLGLTNAILKNLIVRGWIKAKKDTGRKLLYMITPKGMTKVSSLMYKRFQETFHYYHYTRDLITTYLMKLYKEGIRTVNIYGINRLTEITYYAGISTPLKLDEIIEKDLSKEKYLGHPIISIDQFLSQCSKRENNSKQKIIILSTINSDELNKKIEKYKNIKKHIKIINIEKILT